MRWLSKILTVLVLVAACLWAFVPRANREVPAETNEKAISESNETRDNQATRDALLRSAAEKSLDDEYKKLELNYTNTDVQAEIRSPYVRKTLDDLIRPMGAQPPRP